MEIGANAGGKFTKKYNAVKQKTARHCVLVWISIKSDNQFQYLTVFEPYPTPIINKVWYGFIC